jgi:LPS sulfotransferase NodH
MSAGARRPTPFVILTSGRSGSSWLMEMLNSHPAIGGYGELFSTRHKTRFPQTRAATYGDPGGIPFFGAYLGDRRRVNVATVPYWGTQYLNEVFAPRVGYDAIGFRMRYGHLRARWAKLPLSSWFFPYAALKRIRVVHLTRNSLDYLISREVATASGLRHARSEEEVVNPRISLEVETLVRRLDQCEAHERLVRRSIAAFRLRALELTYEDLAADTSSAYRRSVEFLGGAPDHEPRWGMRKVIDTPRSELIENYEGVRRALSGTKYASFLGEHGG